MPRGGRKAERQQARSEAYREKMELRAVMNLAGVKRRERVEFRQQVTLGGARGLAGALAQTQARAAQAERGHAPKRRQRAVTAVQPPPVVLRPPPDADPMHIKPLPKGKPVRVYRVEVRSFHEGFPHVNVHADSSRADLYTAGKPSDVSDWYRTTRDHQRVFVTGSAVGKGKKTPRHDDPRFISKFLASRRDQPGGNRTFYNFGEPARALHFYDQKSTNPTEIRLGNVFEIKSFKVPYEVFARIAKDAVHERDAHDHPTAPLNVDRKAANQFGLTQAYTSLIEAKQIKGTARVDDPERIRRRYGTPEQE